MCLWRVTDQVAVVEWSGLAWDEGCARVTAVDLLGAVDFPGGETAVGGPGGLILASLDRADYLPPPPTAAVAPTDVLNIGHPNENAG